MSMKTQPSKKSIVGSMGLPRYEKPADPEWMQKKERDRQAEIARIKEEEDAELARQEKQRQAEADRKDQYREAEAARSRDAKSSPAANGTPRKRRFGKTKATEEEAPTSEIMPAVEAPREVEKPAPPIERAAKPRARPIDDDEEVAAAPKGGMMSKLMGKKKDKGPAIPVDTRRRRYNETFGAKRASSGMVAVGSGDSSTYTEDDSLSPAQDRARSRSMMSNGTRSNFSGSILGSHALTADEVKSQAQARQAQNHQEYDEESDEADLDEVVDAEPPDVHDDAELHARDGSKDIGEGFAPALTGGYLDEKVPSYDLTDPSSKAYPAEKKSQFPDEDEEPSNNGYIGTAVGALGGVAAGLGLSRLVSGGEKDLHNGAAPPRDEYAEDPALSPTSEKTDGEDGMSAASPASRTKQIRPDKSPKRKKNKMKLAEEKAKVADEKADVKGTNGVAAGVIEDEDEEAVQEEKEDRPNAPVTAAVKTLPKRAKIKPLTSVQRHYMLKALVSLQMQQEFSELEKLGALTQYGFPFSLERPKSKRIKETKLDGELAQGDFEEEADDPYADVDEDEIRKRENLMEPLICRHMFHVHLHSFPGLDDAPVKYWQKRIQPFFDEMAARNFSTSIERSETTARHFYTLAMTRYLGGFFSRGFGVRGDGETRGPGKGAPGTDRWGKGKEWGKGTVKRGLDRPARPNTAMMDKIDALFDGKEGEVWKRARKESTRIKRDWQGFKEFNIERESGLEETMNYLDIGNLRNLPPQYRNAEEYARNHAAYIFHVLFVSSPNADSFYSILKGIHFLFPYWGAKQMLKVANAQTMIQGILSLLLARPAGAKSLVQRIFVSVIGGQASSIDKEYIKPLRKALGDAELTGKIEEYVKRGSRPEGKSIRNRAIRTGQDVVATILLYSGGTELSDGKKQDVLDMHDAFAHSPLRGSVNAAYPEGTPMAKEGKIPDIPNWGVGQDEEGQARRYAMLKLFLRECLRKRDREEACKMASGSLVPSIIKDSLDTVFYGPIKKIAEVSDLSARLGDLQAFFDDIIKTKKAGDNSLPAWIALTARHENSLYFLFHECAQIMKPFTEWLQKGADYMALSTTDPAHPANRRAKNIEINLEEMLRDGRLSDEDVKGIIKEADQLAKYVKWQKIHYELEMRKNFLLAQGDAIPASGLNEDDIPKGGNMKEQIEDVDGLVRELLEQEGEEIEDGTVTSIGRGTEMQDFPWAWFDVVDPLHQHLHDTNPTQLKFKPANTSVKMPSLVMTRKALDPFRQVMVEKMPAWKEGDARGVPATPKVLLNSRQRNIPPAAAQGAPAADQRSVAQESTTDGKKSPAPVAPEKKASMFRLPFSGR